LQILFDQGSIVGEYRTMKNQYLILHDYGTGGVWGLMTARSEQEIYDKYPMVEVIKMRPAWMTDAVYNEIILKNLFDIDDEPRGWLSKLND
jgi:hypothetical protein